MKHLLWHKKRPTVLSQKIEGLLDDCHSKPLCLSTLLQLFSSVGNHIGSEQLLARALKLCRERGDDHGVASILVQLSNTDGLLGLHEEGIRLAKEGLEILERLSDTVLQADCSIALALLLREDKQFDAAGESASRAIDLLPEKGQEVKVSESHRTLGLIYQSKGETEKAIRHLEVALGIASSFNWHDCLFRSHYGLAQLFLDKGRLDDARDHIEHTKPYTSGHPYYLGLMMELQASWWYKQHRQEEARTEALRVVDVYEKLGAVQGLERCRGLLRQIEEEIKKSAVPDESADGGELLDTIPLVTLINTPRSERFTGSK